MIVSAYIRHADAVERRQVGHADLSRVDPVELVKQWGAVDQTGATYGSNADGFVYGQFFVDGASAGFEIVLADE